MLVDLFVLTWVSSLFSILLLQPLEVSWLIHITKEFFV